VYLHKLCNCLLHCPPVPGVVADAVHCELETQYDQHVVTMQSLYYSSHIDLSRAIKKPV